MATYDEGWADSAKSEWEDAKKVVKAKKKEIVDAEKEERAAKKRRKKADAEHDAYKKGLAAQNAAGGNN